jgi:hypothetical protein
VPEGNLPSITSQEANAIRQVIANASPSVNMLDRNFYRQVSGPFVIRFVARHRFVRSVNTGCDTKKILSKVGDCSRHFEQSSPVNI